MVHSSLMKAVVLKKAEKIIARNYIWIIFVQV